MPPLLAYKVVLVAGFLVIVGWIIDYTRIGGKWWRNPIGSTTVYEAALIAGLLVPTTLSLFFALSRTTSEFAAWFDLCDFGLVIPVMVWRTLAYRRIRKRISRCVNGHVLTYHAKFCAECGVSAEASELDNAEAQREP
jgi:hypothetical protein